MLQGVDGDGDGKLSIDEFTRFALQLPRSEGEPKPWSLEMEHEMELSDKRKRPVVLPEGMTEEEGRAILEAGDAERQSGETEHHAKRTGEKKKKKKRKAKAAKDEM